MRRALVAANWKMHGSTVLVDDLIGRLVAGLGQGLNAVDIAICPPAPYLQRVQELARGSELLLGAQNVHSENSGAFTGEVSAAMLADFGVRFVLVGHSERRSLFAEDDLLVARKFAAISGQGQIPVLCVGESLQAREAGQAEAVVQEQLEAVLTHCGVAAFADAVIAYEPVWAIGTGRTASPEQAQAMHASIRGILAQHDKELAEKTRIVYGGSVKSDNAAQLFVQTDIDGGLIGGASLDATAFIQICNSVS